MTTRNTACVSVAPYIKVVNIVVILLNVMVHDSSLSNKMIHVIKEKLVNRCYVGGGGYTNTSYSGSSMLIWTGTSHCEISLADLTPDVPGDVLCLLVALICVRAHNYNHARGHTQTCISHHTDVDESSLRTLFI